MGMLRASVVFILSVLGFTSLYAQGHDFKEVFKSYSEFQELNSSAHFISADTFAAFGYSRFEDEGPFWFTTNQGQDWRSKGYHIRPNMVMRDRSLLVMDLKTLLILNEKDELTISSDSGATFSVVELPFDERVNELKKIGPNILISASGFSSDVYITEDTCRTFKKVTLPLGLGEVVHRQGQYAIMVSSIPPVNSYMETFDLGHTWRQRSYVQNAGSIHRYLDQKTVYTYSSSNRTLKWSTDRLATIDEKIELDIDSNSFISEIVFGTRYIGYLIASDTVLYKTYDGGKTWSPKYTFGHRVNTIELVNQKTVVFHNMSYLSTNSVIYVSNNAGEELALMEPPKRSGLEVYPNPSQNQVFVRYGAMEEGELSIYSMEGVEVYHGTFERSSSIVTSHLESGMYILQLFNSDQSERAIFSVLK